MIEHCRTVSGLLKRPSTESSIKTPSCSNAIGSLGDMHRVSRLTCARKLVMSARQIGHANMRTASQSMIDHVDARRVRLELLGNAGCTSSRAIEEANDGGCDNGG